MANVLFTNVRILDGSGDNPYAGEVLVQGNRVRRVARGTRALPSPGVTVIDGAGATLMPGLCDAHMHISWNDSASLDAIQMMPVEEHVLFCVDIAKRLLDYGFTSAVGAAAAKPRLDVVIRDAINRGQIKGPRYLAASQEIGTLGGLGDTMPPHIEDDRLNFGALVSGPESMRMVVRRFIKYGVDIMKLNLSGEPLARIPSEETPMSEEEIEMAVREAKRRGKRLAAHARSSESVKLCVKHGIEIIYHASYASEEALDILEAAKDKHFVAPGIAWLIRITQNAQQWGFTPDVVREMGYTRELEVAIETMKKMHRRGIKVLPGGDYGFAWTPHGTNAKDLEYFVNLLGFTPMEAIVSATKWGGEIFGKPNELGQVKEGFLADLLLVDGDPVANIRILQDKDRLLAIMKDGEFHKQPDLMPHRQRVAL